jgi:hypothetical protein
VLGLVEEVGMGGGLRLRPSSSSSSPFGLGVRRWEAAAVDEEFLAERRRWRRWTERSAKRRMR